MGVNVSGMASVNDQLKKLENIDKPINSATRRMRTGAKTDASAAIRENVTLKKSYVDKGLNSYARFITAQNKTASVEVTAQRRGALLRNFPHRMTKNGLVITILKGKPVLIRRAFNITLKNGVKTVAWRRSKNAPRGDYQLHGPSPSQILESKKPEVTETIEKRYKKELDHAIRRFLT